MMADAFDSDFAAPGQWAAMYRDAGLQVVPVYTPQEAPKNWKRPCLPEWRQLEFEIVPDLTFTRWFGEAGDYAGRYQLGIITGLCSGNVFVVDLDTHKNPEAAAWWRGLLAVHNNGLELETPRQTTGGGGKQLLFRAPPQWTPPTCRTALGVDIRGQGGFAVLAPSLHDSGRTYEWDAGLAPWETDIADAPEWLLTAVDALVAEHGGSATRHGPRERTAGGDQLDAWHRDADGREDKMARLIWGRLVDLRRDAPMISARELDAEMADAWAVYERTTATRLHAPGLTNADGLEREGRGFSAFKDKWARACRKWDTDISLEAAKAPPARQRVTENDTPGYRVDPETGEFIKLGDDARAAEGERPADDLDLIAWGEIKPVSVRWLIKDFLPAGSFAALFGKPGSYKSFVALYLAAAIGNGAPAFGRDVQPGDVVYIAGEGGAGLKNRIDALAKQHGFGQGTRVHFLRAQLNLRSTLDDAGRLVASIKRRELRPVLIVIDTLARAFAGGNENASEDMGAFIAVTGHIQKALGDPTILIVHHSGKDDARGMRGHSSLFGAIDTELECVKVSDDDSELRVGKLTVTKQKDGEDNYSLPYRLDRIALSPIDPELSSLAVVPDDDAGQADKPHKPKLSGTTRDVLEALERAIADGGQRTIASAHTPANVPCASLDLWRETYRRMSPYDRETADRTFRRGQTQLKSIRTISVWAGQVWLSSNINDLDENRTKRTRPDNSNLSASGQNGQADNPL